jgi:hypothetical protein
VPFDVGRSFIFKPVRGHEEKQWAAIFESDNRWQCHGCFPNAFAEPLGRWARLRLRESEFQYISNWMSRTLSASSIRFEAVFSALGIAVLIVRVQSDGPAAALIKSCNTQNEALIKQCTVVISSIARVYKQCFDTGPLCAGGDTRRRLRKDETRLLELKDVARFHGVGKAEYLYPVFFLEGRDYAMAVRDGLAEASSPNSLNHSYNGVKTNVGWARALVECPSGPLRERIENNFIIADACWFALTLMERLVSIYLLDAFVGLAAEKPRLRDKESRTIRLAYMEAANATHPIRWTSEGHDLSLLEDIHKSWGSSRWWSHIEQRTLLLTTHYNELDAEVDRRRDNKFALAGAVIAAFTLASALSDLFSLNKTGQRWQVWIAVGVPVLIIALIIFILWRRPRE